MDKEMTTVIKPQNRQLSSQDQEKKIASLETLEIYNPTLVIFGEEFDEESKYIVQWKSYIENVEGSKK